MKKTGWKIIGVISMCYGCDWREEDYRKGIKAARDHARKTGHEVAAEVTRTQTYNSKR